jgi:hypothetical protein
VKIGSNLIWSSVNIFLVPRGPTWSHLKWFPARLECSHAAFGHQNAQQLYIGPPFNCASILYFSILPSWCLYIESSCGWPLVNHTQIFLLDI